MKKTNLLLAAAIMLIVAACSQRTDKLTGLIPEKSAFVAKFNIESIITKGNLADEKGNFRLSPEIGAILDDNGKSFVSRVVKTLPSSGLKFSGNAYLFGGIADFQSSFVAEVADAADARKWLCALTNEVEMKEIEGVSYIFDDNILYVVHDDVMFIGFAGRGKDAARLVASVKAAFERKERSIESNELAQSALDKEADVAAYVAVGEISKNIRKMSAIGGMSIGGMPVADILAGMEVKALSVAVSLGSDCEIEADVVADATSAYKMMFSSVVAKPSAEFLGIMPSSMENVLSLSLRGADLLRIPAFNNLLMMTKSVPIVRNINFSKLIATIDGPVAVGWSRDANFVDEYNVVVAVASTDPDAVIYELNDVAMQYGKVPQRIDGENVYEYFNQRITVGVSGGRYVYFKLNNYQSYRDFMDADTAKVALFGKSPIGLSMQGSGCDVTVGFNSADRISCRFRADGADANIVESIIRLMCSVEPSRDFADDDFDDYGDDFGSATPIDGFSAF